jgi:5S rRNA maturation endonuclease (ribonuclease M5)
MKEYINFSAKLNEIRLLLRHPLYKRKAMMIVEGGSDIRLFRSLLSAETVKIESRGERLINLLQMI